MVCFTLNRVINFFAPWNVMWPAIFSKYLFDSLQFVFVTHAADYNATLVFHKEQKEWKV